MNLFYFYEDLNLNGKVFMKLCMIEYYYVELDIGLFFVFLLCYVWIFGLLSVWKSLLI